MSDLISRHAAIDMLMERASKLRGTVGDLGGACSGAAKLIAQLPSAQPDIIQCRNCKFASGDSRICMQFGHSPIGELDFCAWRKGEPMRNDYITRLVQICLDIANIADERGEVDKPYFEELGLGYRALSGILRRGCKEIIDLQNNYHGAIEAKNLAKIGEKEAHDVLEEMFGDREVYTINDKDKERIKAFVRSIQDEWERRTDDLQ